MLSTCLSNTSLQRLQSLDVDLDSASFCKEFDIFLVSLQDREPNCYITNSLSTFNMNFEHIKFLDLGVIKNNDILYLDDLKKEVYAQNKRIIVLNSRKETTHNPNSTLVSATPTIESLDRGDIRFLSYQRHYLPKKNSLEKDTSHKSLGEIDKNITVIEPILRSSRELYFEMSAIRSTEFPNYTEYFNPVGLSILQSCKIARYSGFSKELKQITISDFSFNSKAHCHSIALWIWYYLEGRDLDEQVNKNSVKDITSYIVNSSELDMELEFIKENKSERWWLLNPANSESKIPCLYEDYLAVINEDSEEKILELLKSRDNSF